MRRARGFTLIEMLVAIAIFAIVAVLAYGGLSSIINQTGHTDAYLQRLQEIRRGVIILERDILQVVPRAVRQGYQNLQEPALRGGNSGVMELELTRGGWRNPTGLPRSTLQRVAWDFDGDTLYRLQWPVLDASPAAEPQKVTVIEKLQGFSVRFRDASGQWHEQWPPLEIGNVPDGGPVDVELQLPTAVEFLLDIEDLGRIRRIVETPGP